MKTLRHQGSTEAADELYSLACGPDPRVTVYTGCIVNGVRFRTKERDDRRTTQNSGILVPGAHDEDVVDFYGQLCNIYQINYIFGYNVILFKCDWFDTDPKKRKVQRNLHITSINVSSTWYKTDPFVLASQVCQVFYLDDYKLGSNWKVVQKVQHRHIWDIPEKDTFADSSIDAYQEPESSNVHCHVQESDLEALHFARTDIDPSSINAEKLHHVEILQSTNCDDDMEEEDETLLEYCSDIEMGEEDNE